MGGITTKRGKVIDLDYIKRIYTYDPESGNIYYRVKAGRVSKGTKAGSLYGHGYIIIGKPKYCAHHIAWFLYYNEWPTLPIDHINGIRDDNRIINLRMVTDRENSQNLPIHRGGKLVGVHLYQDQVRWEAGIKINSKAYNLGAYDTKEAAYEAYIKAAEHAKLDPEWHPPRIRQERKGYYPTYKNGHVYWKAGFKIKERHIHLGSYKTKEDAQNAYQTYMKSHTEEQ